MKEIWKYELNLGVTDVYIPGGAKFLDVQMQGFTPYVWVLVDPEIQTFPYRLSVIGTGQSFNEEEVGEYVGTFQMDSGALVWHVFAIMLDDY